ncbi:GMP synthase [Operophtera brumata]|uniref:GMP synthase n=1 Tax=Operophtera brumata TaxID=104452 RepID=A0A0L7LAI6_OPEBR|nr:GMP synthase [Operophtera brumata]
MLAARRDARAPLHRDATDRDSSRARDMPAVKVFNIFGGQKPTEKHPTAPCTPMQKLYRTFSLGSESSPEPKGKKVTAIAACLEKRISDPVKKVLDTKSDNVHNSAKIENCVVNKVDSSKAHHVYENVNIVSGDRHAIGQEKLLDETKGYSSIYEPITFLGNLNDTKKECEDSPESKLNKALKSFDKILHEFSATSLEGRNTFIPPKLQKSKTCSIIESHCILKKANSDPEGDSKDRKQVARNNSIGKTTSLWNLDDMKGKELTAPLMPLKSSTPIENMNPDKYATYKISSKNSSRPNCIKNEELKKLDVKTRILKKTLSNPPSTPVPVVAKTKPVVKKVEKRVSDPKKIKPKSCSDNGSLNIKTCIERKATPKSQMQKAKSVWEIGNESMFISNLERTRSTTSITGSPSKIPVIRGQMSNNKFSSTRALFSPTPVDLNNVDQARECAQKKKPIVTRKNYEINKSEINRQTRQKSQLCLKSDAKRVTDRTKKETFDVKKTNSSPNPTVKDYTDEINAMRAKLQQKKIKNKRDLVVSASDAKRNENVPNIIDPTLSPVKLIVKKLELNSAMETKAETQFVNCKIIPATHKELCVANTTFHNHLSTLVGRQIKYVESRDDVKTCSQVEKLALHKHADEKISDTHSDCSDDSGHVSNDAANETFDAVDLSGVDEVDCKVFDGPKQFGKDVPENAISVCPVRPARRGRLNEVASGTRATDSPKVDEQVRDTVNLSITNYRCCLSELPRREHATV